MMTEEDDNKITFNIPYHFCDLAQAQMVTIPGRIKRLAIEIGSLASALPICRESAIFIRHDASRIDVMKVCPCCNDLDVRIVNFFLAVQICNFSRLSLLDHRARRT